METAIQLALPLFREPTFDELLQQHPSAGSLSIIILPRLRRSWQVKVCVRSGERRLFVPAALAEAPGPVKTALIEWALLPLRTKGRGKKDIRFKKTELERIIWRHLESSGGRAVRRSRLDPERIADKTPGRIYDLREIFNSVNKKYFDGTLSSHLRWGPPLSKTSHHTIRTDRTGTTVNLITIAGVYNHPAVPRFAIEAVMYHEMLHIAIPPWKKNGRRVVHGASFKKAERSFGSFREWQAWERTSLPWLLQRKRNSI
jgi:hypothetical protein